MVLKYLNTTWRNVSKSPTTTDSCEVIAVLTLDSMDSSSQSDDKDDGGETESELTCEGGADSGLSRARAYDLVLAS